MAKTVKDVKKSKKKAGKALGKAALKTADKNECEGSHPPLHVLRQALPAHQAALRQGPQASGEAAVAAPLVQAQGAAPRAHRTVPRPTCAQHVGAL